MSKSKSKQIAAGQVTARLQGKVNPFAYMLTPETVAELKTLGITFTSIETSGLFAKDPDAKDWPILVLPSGTCLCIAQDDEGNGPGAIHEEI
jgi:hypothetical protein